MGVFLSDLLVTVKGKIITRKDRIQSLRIVDLSGEFVAKHDDRCRVVYESAENSIISMPPSIVLDDFLSPGVVIQAPPKSVVFNALLFMAISRIGGVQRAFFKKGSGCQRSVPFI